MIILADLSVIKPDPGLLIWTVIIFGLFWALLGKFAFKPISNAIKRRNTHIDEALNEAKRAREEMAQMKADNQKLLTEAREERAQIIKDAKAAAGSIVGEAKEKARSEAKQIVENASAEIEKQKSAAVYEIRAESGKLAVQIAEKILERELSDPAAQQEYARKMINDIKLN